MFLGESLDLLLDFWYGNISSPALYTQALHQTYSANHRNLRLKKGLESTVGWNHIDTVCLKPGKEITTHKARSTVSSQPAKGTLAKLGSMETIAKGLFHCRICKQRQNTGHPCTRVLRPGKLNPGDVFQQRRFPGRLLSHHHDTRNRN